MANPREGLGFLLNGQPALVETLMRGLNLKGALPQYLDRDIQPGLNLLDLTAFEFRWLRRMQTFDAAVNIAAPGAGNLPVFFLGTNAATNRTVQCKVESALVCNNGAAAAIVQWGVNYIATGAATTTFGLQADDRMFPISRGSYGCGFNGPAIAAQPLTGTGAPIVTLAPNQSIYLPGPWLLSGKDNAVVTASFFVVGLTANQPLQVSVRWTEREQLASEL